MEVSPFAEAVNPHTDPKQVIYDVLARMSLMKENLTVPMRAFKEASSKKQRKGVTFFVTIEHMGETEDVPFRVENSAVIRTRFATERQMSSWRDREVFSITVRVRQTIGELMRQIEGYLTAALNRFKHRLERKLHHKNQRQLKRSVRDDRCRRMCVQQVCCH